LKWVPRCPWSRNVKHHSLLIRILTPIAVNQPGDSACGEIFKLLDGGLRDGGWMGEGRPRGGHALAILPGLTHYNLAVSPLFAAVTLDFLDAQSGG
jgi:hypothetical protein